MTGAFAAFHLGLVPVLMATLSMGPQNIFVFRHGLTRDHIVFVTCICLGCDVVIIVSAMLGVGALIAAAPLLARLLSWGGAGCLLLCAGRLLRGAWVGYAVLPLGEVRCSEGGVLLRALAVSLLNPMVWAETGLVLGGLAATVNVPSLPYFGLGATVGSLAKFSILGFLATGLAPLFVRRSVRRGFDALAGATMFTLAVVLVWSSLPVSAVPQAVAAVAFQ